jgi:predicted lactoylglutathione lyase
MEERFGEEGLMTSAASSIPAELSMVVLTSRDLPRLRRFYRALGWSEQAGATDELCRFQLGQVVLTLYPDEGPLDEQQPREPSHVTLVVRLSSRELLDEAHRTALDAGAEPVSPPTDQSWGGRASVVADPDGNRWEFLWVPTHPPEH